MACKLCNCNCGSADGPEWNTLRYECQTCGRYVITGDAIGMLQNNERGAFDIASWVYEQSILGVEPFISSQELQNIWNRPKPSTQKRVELYLGRAIKLLSNNLTGKFDAADAVLRVASWSFRNEDATAIADYLKTLGAVEPLADHLNQYRLVAKAHILYQPA